MKNRILKNSIVTMLILALTLSGLFSYPKQVEALTVEKTVTKYHLDIGAQHIWGTGKDIDSAVWQNGNKKGGSISVNVSIDFPKEISNVRVYQLTSSNYKWGEDGYSFNETPYLNNQYEYYENYRDYASTSIYNISKPSISGKTVSFSYTATLASKEDFDLKGRLKNGGLNFILDLMGGKDTDGRWIAEKLYPDTYKRLVEGAQNGIADNVYGFMYFTPVVIQYDVKEAVPVLPGDFIPDIDLPSSAKVGETFPVTDTTVFGKPEEFALSELSCNIDGGSESKITSWDGSRLGSSITQSFDKACTVYYTLKVWNIYGDSKSVTKSINITDNKEIKGQAILKLPKTTYEGHPAYAEDYSVFKVDGEDYGARRMYEEGLASNQFLPQPHGSGTASVRTLTTADVVFPKRGNYEVKLDIRTIDGQNLSDTKPIEVLKTPYIIDDLGGYQKENRKQILNIAVATYPGKPITDYYVELLDMKTGQSITLTAGNPQVNNATIKTRTLKSSGDEYWTNFTLEFLTKNTTSQDYRYTIYMKDSKGDTASVQKVFQVAPDLPPVPSIVIPDTFIRNQGTNIAEIKAEDGSTTDGDQLQRTWTVSGTNVKSLPGYQDQSFGSGQKVKYNKTGVGKETIQLSVKDVWNEPTLEEYITNADYLSATTTAATEIINIAPVVRLEPKRYITANISILADRNFKTAVEDQMNSIRAKLLEKGIDGLLQVVPVDVPNTNGDTCTLSQTWKASYCNVCAKNGAIADSTYAYIVKPASINASDYGNTCTGPHTIYTLTESGNASNPKVAWSYTVNESSDFEISEDSNERYIFVHCNDIGKTILLNRNNGAYLTTIGSVLPKSPFVSEDGQRLYYVTSNGVLKYDTQSNSLTTLLKDPGYIPRIQNGKLTYVASEGSSLGKFYIAQLDMTSETLECISLPTLNPIESAAPVDMDQDGRVVFKRLYTNTDRDIISYRYWYADSKTNTMFSGVGSYASELDASSTGFVRDETVKSVAFYRYQVSNSEGSHGTWHYYVQVYISKIKPDGSLEAERCVYDDSTSYNPSNIIYARYHTDENAIYLVQGASVDNYDIRTTKSFRISLSDWSVDFGTKPAGFDDFEEASAENGNLVFSSLTGLGRNNENRVKLFRYNISQAQSESKAMLKDSQFKDGILNYIVQIKDTGENLSDEIQKLAENFALQGITAKLSNAASDIANKISAAMEEETPKLHLKGNSSNLGTVTKTLTIPANSSFEYEYDVASTTGAAIDMLSVQPISTGLAAGEKEYFKEIIDTADFTSSVGNISWDYARFQCSPYISAYTDGQGHIKGNYRDYPGIRTGEWENSERETSCGFSFYLARPGFVEFDYYGAGAQNSTLKVDSVQCDKAQANGTYDGHRLVFLSAGSHTVSMSVYGGSVVGFTKASIGYLYDSDTPLNKTSIINGNTVKGSFGGPKGSGYIKSKIGEAEYVSDIWQYTYAYAYPSDTFRKNSNSFWVWSTYSSSAGGQMVVTAPSDKILFLTFSDNIYNDDPYFSISRSLSNAKELASGSYVIFPGGSYRLNVSGLSANGGGSIDVNNIQIATLPAYSYGLYSTYTTMYSGDYGKPMVATLNNGQPDYIEVKSEGGKVVLSRISRVGTESFLKKMKISFTTSITSTIKDQYISNFKLYRKAGYRKLVLSEHFFSDRVAKENGWSFSSTGSGICQIEIQPKMEKEEKESLVYNKGELVAYNIYYEDYENDPSKKEYWLYVHTPMNDGEHKDAAVICDEDGNVTKVLGKTVTSGALTVEQAVELAKKDGSKTLSSSIPRFYVDGKYTVYHWQEDNTNRTGDASGKTDYTKYDKLSNVESLTFYIKGGGIAPWVTSIQTIPGTLKEGDKYQLQIGVDDVEKDALRLTTEVYKEKKLIFTHKATNITANAAGVYPYITTGYLPLAVGGKYEVVCTVRDWSGAGIGTYKYIVLSGGKITGFVNHTDQWDNNRKKYNLKRFSEEINRTMQFNDYIAMPTPRKRGTNVFWSGERFLLQSETEGNPTRVKVQLFSLDESGKRKSTGYSTELSKTGKKSSSGAELWDGNLWDEGMINKWGRKAPEQLLFSFTAYYSGGTTKTNEVTVIVDSEQDYWQLHRLW